MRAILHRVAFGKLRWDIVVAGARRYESGARGRGHTSEVWDLGRFKTKCRTWSKLQKPLLEFATKKMPCNPPISRSCERPSPQGFACDGFVVLNEFLDGLEVAEIQKVIESLPNSLRDLACVHPHNTLLPLRWNDHIVQLALGSEHRLQRLRDALRRRRPEMDFWVCKHEGSPQPGFMVAPRLVVLGSFRELSTSGCSSSDSVLSNRYRPAQWGTPSLARLSSQKRANTRSSTWDAQAAWGKP